MMAKLVVRGRVLLFAVGWAVLGVPTFAQNVAADAKPLVYDVVSVKQNTSGPGHDTDHESSRTDMRRRMWV